VSPTSVVLRDVNCDGKKDLLLYFSIPQIASAGALVAGSTQAEVTGTMQDDTTFRGTDSVTIVSSCASAASRSSFGSLSHTNTITHSAPVFTHSSKPSGRAVYAPVVEHKSVIVSKPPVVYKPVAVHASLSASTRIKTSYAAVDTVFHSMGSTHATVHVTSRPSTFTFIPVRRHR
jgi:hypothetical protein